MYIRSVCAVVRINFMNFIISSSNYDKKNMLKSFMNFALIIFLFSFKIFQSHCETIIVQALNSSDSKNLIIDNDEGNIIINSYQQQLPPLSSSILLNDAPIIGILTQEITPSANNENNGRLYIASSYVKLIEGAGGRVVPIWIGKGEEYYEEILSQINGVLLPGGATYFNYDAGYADAGMIIYKIAKRKNNNGIYFPIWGTCLGFELLTYLSANRVEHRAKCNSYNQALNLDFKPDFRSSRLFKYATKNVIHILKNEYVTANFHGYCVTETNFTCFGLNRIWKVLSTNKDWNGFEFISSVEHYRYPFYGVQFHPEKNLYEWVENRNISHAPNAILASQYFANFFVNETRKNKNKFHTKADENSRLIYNYQPEYTGSKGSVFEQIYVFSRNHNDGNSNKDDT